MTARPTKGGALYALPNALWLTLFFLAPLLIIVAYSFMKKGLYGGVEPEFSLHAYALLANAGIVKVAFRTLLVALAATALTILVALPVGYNMARSKNQTLKLFLVIVPFWTNFLIRIYAWIAILGNEGTINGFLRSVGLVSDPIHLMYNQGAVILVLVYMYLPYAVLPLFSTMDKFDFILLDAARDLGAGKLESIVKVMLPNVRSGLVTAVLFTFIPIFGAYAVPLLVGGKDGYMLGNVIADQVMKVRDWPFASSISMVVTFVSTVGVLLFLARQKRPGISKEQAAALAAEAAVAAGGGR